MELAVLWLVFAIAVAVLADRRGRSSLMWFVLAVVLSPLIALIFVLVMADKKAQAREATVERVTTETHVRCPDCRELVRKDASKCKHCGTALVPQR